MVKYAKYLLIIGSVFLLLSVILMVLSTITSDSYLIFAIRNLLSFPAVVGLFLILFASLLFIWKKKRSGVIKLFIVLSLISLMPYFFSNPIGTYIKDIIAVTQDDLYITEGEVIKTNIVRHSSAVSSRNSQDRFYQHFKLDNGNEDEFSIFVGYSKNNTFDLNKRYQIVALPHTLTIVGYEEK